VTDDERSLDDLELELRMLPGVRATGFDDEDDVLFVQLHMTGDPDAHAETMTATRIAARHANRSVAVEVAHWRTIPTAVEDRDDAYVDLSSELPLVPELLAPDEPRHEDAPSSQNGASHRPRLLAVLSFPDTDELEVHLIHDGRRTIGRAAASRGLVGAVEATLDAIRGLGVTLDPQARWARVLDSNGDARELVAVAVAPDAAVDTCNYGLAAGVSAIDAAARSTLDALNRQLAVALA